MACEPTGRVTAGMAATLPGRTTAAAAAARVGDGAKPALIAVTGADAESDTAAAEVVTVAGVAMDANIDRLASGAALADPGERGRGSVAAAPTTTVGRCGDSAAMTWTESSGAGTRCGRQLYIARSPSSHHPITDRAALRTLR